MKTSFDTSLRLVSLIECIKPSTYTSSFNCNHYAGSDKLRANSAAISANISSISDFDSD